MSLTDSWDIISELPRPILLRFLRRLVSQLPDEQVLAIITDMKISSKKKHSGPDWKIAPRRHVAIAVCYDGTEYAGLAYQTDEYTVENTFMSALKAGNLIPPDATQADIHFERSGRTDKGVSCAMQIFSLYVLTRSQHGLVGDLPNPDPRFYRDRRDGSEPPCKISSGGDDTSNEIDYTLLLNSKLPSTIRVLGWCPVDANFSARHSAKSRTYRYVLGPVGTLNVARMAEACTALIGHHDYRNVCKPVISNVITFERQILECALEIDGSPYSTLKQANDDNISIAPDGMLVLVVRGTAFLYHQIRCIASLLLHIGAELEPPTVINDLLDVEKLPGKPDYPIAPGELLLLKEVEYTPTRLPNLIFTSASVGYLRRNIHFLASRAYARYELYKNVLAQLPEGAPPQPHENPLVVQTLTHRMTDSYEHYFENGLRLTRIGRFKRICSRPYDAEFPRKLSQRQRETEAYTAQFKEE
ncbi:putative tRNA pseudouridine38/39 synthase [Giardia muris]|uniref:tRNA pseudouridine synthase n=1 Tax=Giardia muris TaxID=5742 RepID=A0A4Z1T859_GIAMU|nr:putative tRNA pseudouridine38/39 synthase [Giardia muris]|eukprot:TNJ29357.1 putative tRNA pseudouridine38/39 synthase [Giardia muris]